MKLRFLLILLTLNVSVTQANSISLAQVTQDVTALASDDMGGRASFTQGSEKAAKYIAQRFSEIGLSPLAGQKSFMQSFELYQIKVDKVEAILNGIPVPSKNALLLSRHEQLSWNKKTPQQTLYIKADDNFAQKMSQFNQLDKDILIIADESHKEMFNRYRNYFSRAQNKFNINQGPSALVLLSPETEVKSLQLVSVSHVTQKSLTNVVGQLSGKDMADEMVLFSAHYDHLGVTSESPAVKAEQEKPDLIYNGADDDASGTSAVINIAQYYAQKKNNQRSLVFVAFAAEELGGFGSKYFSEKLNPDKITAMLNIEMIGKPSKFGSGEFWMTGFKRSNLASILNTNLKNKQIHPDPYPKQQLFYRSDNATLARLGVPAHSFSSTQIDKDQHYHKVSDELATLDLESMTAVIQSLAESVETIVIGTDTPTRINSDNVKKKGNYF